MHLSSKRATIKEVASAAGVSTQTVSRVINNRPDVSPATRKHVQQIIDQMDYQPSALARSLIRQRSFTLAVVTAGLKYIGPSRTLSGITKAAEEAGYSLLMKEILDFNANNIEPIFQKLISRHVDGIIWAVPEVGDNRDWIKNSPLNPDFPIVYLAMEPREALSVVSAGNYEGARIAVGHLLEQGYQHIGHLSGPLDWWEGRQRKTGWQDRLKEAGREVKETHYADGNWSAESGVAAIQKLLTQYPEMDAVFVGNDQMALSVLQQACQEGIKIPDDLGVVGFDNIPESAYFWPPLTTINQDHHRVGEIAVEEIIKIIENRRQEGPNLQFNPITLPTSLVVRKSSVRN